VFYSGSAVDEPRLPVHVVQLNHIPKTARVLGTAEARCEAPKAGPLDEVLLSDLNCTPLAMAAALRAATAAVGGSLLLSVECEEGERVYPALVNHPPQSRVVCSGQIAEGHATFAELERGLRTHLPVDELPLELALQAFRVRVTTRATNDSALLTTLAPHGIKPGRPSQVVPRVPAFDRTLASLDARCETDCDLNALRAALVLGSTHLGAEHVVFERCFRAEDELVCTGLATSPHL
jgi:hypothetical protein